MKAVKNLLLTASLLFVAFSSSAQACANFLDRGGYWVIENTCGRTITVRWTDQGSCSSRCAARIGSYSSQTISAPRGRLSYDED